LVKRNFGVIVMHGTTIKKNHLGWLRTEFKTHFRKHLRKTWAKTEGENRNKFLITMATCVVHTVRETEGFSEDW